MRAIILHQNLQVQKLQYKLSRNKKKLIIHYKDILELIKEITRKKYSMSIHVVLDFFFNQ